MILDHRGRPIDESILTEEVSGPSFAKGRTIVHTRPTYDLTPRKMAAILREAEQPGYGASERYVEMAEAMEERDMHYMGVLQTRRRQVSQIGVTIEPASDSAQDVADAELVEEFFKRDTVEDELIDLLDAIGKGYSVCEIIWEMSESQWMPRRLEWRLPEWFDFDYLSGNIVMRRDLGHDEMQQAVHQRMSGLDAEWRGGGGWIELEPYKHVTHVVKTKSGLPIRGGLARCAAWSWMFKSYTLKDWARFAEAYGQPLRIGKYQPGSSDADRAVLYRAVANLSADAAAIIPEGMVIEFPAPQDTAANSGIYKDFVTYIDGQMSIAVLGQTLTTDVGDSGSRALGDVHNQVRGDIERSDGRQLAATLRRDLVIPIVCLNHGERKAYPMVKIEREPSADLELLGKYGPALVDMGLPIAVDDVLSKFNLKRPDDNDEILQHRTMPGMRDDATDGNGGLPEPDPEADPDDGPQDGDRRRTPMRRGQQSRRTRMAAARAQARQPARRDVVDQELDWMLEEWAPLVDPIVEPLLAAARESSDLPAFRDKLPGLVAEMDDRAVQQLLHRLSFSGRISAAADDQG